MCYYTDLTHNIKESDIGDDMNKLSEYSYIWETDKEKYVLVDDDLGRSIFFIKDKEIMFFLLEDDDLLDMIICKMIESGNKKYSSVTELQNDIRN